MIFEPVLTVLAIPESRKSRSAAARPPKSRGGQEGNPTNSQHTGDTPKPEGMIMINAERGANRQ
jgi:hypothetical protein